jgi:histidinol-phosphate aminotransferase
MQLPYHINTVSLSMAAEVLKHYELVAEVIEKIKEERRWLMEALKSIGVKPFPSDANFILTKTPKSSTFVSNALMKRNVLVRSFGDIPLLEGCIRITVGSRMMNDRVVSALKEII